MLEGKEVSRAKIDLDKQFIVGGMTVD